MRNSRIASFGLAVFVTLSGCQAGPTYEEAIARANWVLYPSTIEEAESEKLKCERHTKMSCAISGFFIPDIKGRPEPAKPMGPAI